MLREKLGLDEKDIKIMGMYLDDPSLSQQDVAGKLGISQPAANMRIQKLQKKGILKFSAGINISKSNLILTRVDFTAKDAKHVLDSLKNCHFFINGFIMSGKNNTSILMVTEDLKKVEEVINAHIRGNPQISDINVNVIVSCANDFIAALKLERELHETHPCQLDGACENCQEVTSLKIDKR